MSRRPRLRVRPASPGSRSARNSIWQQAEAAKRFGPPMRRWPSSPPCRRSAPEWLWPRQAAGGRCWRWETRRPPSKRWPGPTPCLPAIELQPSPGAMANRVDLARLAPGREVATALAALEQATAFWSGFAAQDRAAGWHGVARPKPRPSAAPGAAPGASASRAVSHPPGSDWPADAALSVHWPPRRAVGAFLRGETAGDFRLRRISRSSLQGPFEGLSKRKETRWTSLIGSR